jgi:ribosomal protein S18 acetylase RimI-like enzyme
MENITLEELGVEQKEFDENRARKAMRDLLEQVNLHGSEASEYYSFYELLDIITRVSGDYAEWHKKQTYTENTIRVIVILAEEVCEFARQDNANYSTRFSRIKDPYERKEHYADVFQDIFVDGSPCIFGLLSDLQMFKIITTCDQIPNLDVRFSSDLFAEMVYQFAFSSPDYLTAFLDDVRKQLIDAQVSDQVAIITKVAQIGFSALDAGYYNAEEIIPYIIEFLEKLSEDTEIPFVGISASLSGRHLKGFLEVEFTDEVTDVELENLIYSSRLERKKRSAEALKYKYDVKSLGQAEEVRVISSDYTAVYGDNGRPIELALRKIGANFVDTQNIFNLPANIPFGSEKKLKDIRYLYEQVQTPLVATFIEQVFGIDFSKMSLRSQIQLIEYISKQSIQQYNDLMRLRINGKIPDSFYGALFAVNANKEVGEALVDCARNFDPEITDSLCSKYNTLIQEIYQIEIMIGNFFADKTKNEVDARRAVQEFSKRAADILFKAAKNPERADEFFASATKDILMFSSIFKAAVKTGVEFKLEDVAGLDVTSFKGNELPEEIRTSLKEITAANWLVRGEVGKNVVGGFNSVVDQGGEERMWHILRRGNEVVSFVRFDGIQKSGDEQLHEYAGSFNVHPAYRGSAIGEAMMNEVLIEESRRAVLHATMDPRIDVGTRYVEDIGFLVTGVAENYLDTAESFFEITADQAVLGNFESRGWTREQALTFARERVRESLIVQAERGDIIVASVTRDAGAEPAFISGAAEILRAGFVGTRYLSEGEGSKVRYMIFEKSK